MSKWATPKDFKSDGCTWPSIFDRIMGSKRYKDVCRRHDFECRYSLRTWKNARAYLIKGVKRQTPIWLMWRIPIFYIGLWFARERCEWTYPEPLRLEWLPYIDRDYQS